MSSHCIVSDWLLNCLSFSHTPAAFILLDLSKCCFASFTIQETLKAFTLVINFFSSTKHLQIAVLCIQPIPTNLVIKYGCRSVTRLFRNSTIFNTLNRTENLLLYDCSHRPRNSHPYWTSRFFLQVFKWAQRSSVVLGVCVSCVFVQSAHVAPTRIQLWDAGLLSQKEL